MSTFQFVRTSETIPKMIFNKMGTEKLKMHKISLVHELRLHLRFLFVLDGAKVRSLVSPQP